MASALAREDVTFRSGGLRCAAWRYRPPEGTATLAPCVVMAHGFGAVRALRLDAYARRFAAAGYHVLAFDYRHFGDSEGEPRQLLDIGRQLDDFRAAIAFARALDGVDPARIALWGTSFAGGHVLVLAAEDPAIAAVVAQVPHTSGWAAARAAPVVGQLRLAAAAVRDRLGAALGRPPRYVPLVGEPGALAAMTTAGAAAALARMNDTGAPVREDVAARVFLRVPWYSPGRRAREIRCPLLALLADRDRLTPPDAAERAIRRAPRGEVRRYAIDHFDIYDGVPFEVAVADTLAFLARSA